MTTEPLHAAVKRLRQQRELSLRRLAALAYTTHGHISKIENGKRQPSPDLVKALDHALQAEGALIAIAEAALGERRRVSPPDASDPTATPTVSASPLA